MTDTAFRRYGAPHGRLVVYLHGVPGDATEGAWFADAATRAGVDLHCLERSNIALDLQGEPYFQAIARRIDGLAAGAPYVVVGFSLGAFVAMRTAPYLAGRATRMHLVSAAAPLEGGDFLPHMAGQPVFRAARASNLRLRLLIGIQKFLAAAAPGVMVRLLFAAAPGRRSRARADPRVSRGSFKRFEARPRP